MVLLLHLRRLIRLHLPSHCLRVLMRRDRAVNLTPACCHLLRLLQLLSTDLRQDLNLA